MKHSGSPQEHVPQSRSGCARLSALNLQTKPRVLVLLSLAYIITRFGCLGRELGYEEGFFLAPGIALFHSGQYRIYWGELFPDFTPFQKPPLTSLVLGLFSMASFDPVAGARLVPF